MSDGHLIEGRGDTALLGICVLQEVEEIFTAGDCASFVSCEPANNGYWYVTFETEEQAQQAFHYINETLQEYRGQRIMVGCQLFCKQCVSFSHVYQMKLASNMSIGWSFSLLKFGLAQY